MIPDDDEPMIASRRRSGGMRPTPWRQRSRSASYELSRRTSLRWSGPSPTGASPSDGSFESSSESRWWKTCTPPKWTPHRRAAAPGDWFGFAGEASSDDGADGISGDERLDMPGAPGCGRQSFQLYSAEGSGRFREEFEARSSCGVSSRSSELSAVSDGGETRTTALFIARTRCENPR